MKKVMLLCFIILVACGKFVYAASEEFPKYLTGTVKDVSGEHSITLLYNNCLSFEESCEDAEFNVEEFTTKANKNNYYIRIDISTRFYPLIGIRYNLNLIVDNKKEFFTPSLDKERLAYHWTWNKVNELKMSAFYKISGAQLEKISNAKSVEFELLGIEAHKGNAVRGGLNDKNIANIKRFYDEYVAVAK